MLSILIPVFNYDMNTLVLQLIQQCELNKIDFEIICLDDASSAVFQTINSKLPTHKNLTKVQLSNNIGRSSARNKLTSLAKFDNLLFLDCDVQLMDEAFIKNYIDTIQNEKHRVIYGSCLYPSDVPKDTRLLLHWKYGLKKENPSLKYRLKNPYLCFHTVNFIVNKSIALKFPFDENIKLYGHEDSLWAMQLKQHQIEILHIDNPVLHLGLHPVKFFLRNTSQAIKNIIQINSKQQIIPSKLIVLYQFIKSCGLHSLYFQIYRYFERKIVRNLMGNNPSLRFYSFYKLGLFIRFKIKL
ncbi:MAG: glycosyltransferase [Saprospiraceae bacterium]